jgi:hypothetical protein
MNEYTYIVFDHNGRRLGKIEFGVRNSVPSAKEIKKPLKMAFPTGRLIITRSNKCVYQPVRL